MTFYPTQIIGANSPWGRESEDFYPTPPDVTQALLDFLDLKGKSTIWEPACGDGAMSYVLEVAGHNVISTDLFDRGYGLGGVDFLAQTRPEEVDAVITNPPFRMAEAFIKQARNDRYPLVAMLLKSQYWHAKGRRQLFLDYPPTWVLPLTWRPAFLADKRGKSPLMDVLWTVWEYPNYGSTSYAPLPRPEQVPDTPLRVRLARAVSAAGRLGAILNA